APEVGPGSIQILAPTLEDICGSGFVDRILPGERDLAARVALEKGEGFDHHRKGGMKPGAGGLQRLPLLPRMRVQRITREGECNPCPTVDECGFALAHQVSS